MAEYSLICSNHPDQTTSLRCNKCNRPICARCAVQTPVGYRCRDCLRGQQAVFDTARAFDPAVAFVIGAVGVGIAVYLLAFVEVWGLFLAPVVGTALATAIRALLRNRRARAISMGATIGGAIGIAANIGLLVMGMFQWYGPAGISAIGLRQLLTFLWPIAHGFVVTIVLYARLRTPGT